MYTITKLGQMVLKGINWVHNGKIRKYGLERSNLCTQWKKSENLVLCIFTKMHHIFHLICIKCIHFPSNLHKMCAFWKMCENT